DPENVGDIPRPSGSCNLKVKPNFSGEMVALATLDTLEPSKTRTPRKSPHGAFGQPIHGPHRMMEETAQTRLPLSSIKLTDANALNTSFATVHPYRGTHVSYKSTVPFAGSRRFLPNSSPMTWAELSK